MNNARPPSAFALTQAMSALQAARERLLTEDPDIAADEALMADILGSDPATSDEMEILHRVLRAAVHAKDMAAAADARAGEIVERRDRYRRREMALRGAAFAALNALGLRRLELPDLVATIAAGSVAVVVTDETALPSDFVRVKREPDKAAIGIALKAGEVVPGAEL